MRKFLLIVAIIIVGAFYLDSKLDNQTSVDQTSPIQDDEYQINYAFRTGILKVKNTNGVTMITGSAVVFDEDDDHYYLLTNYHVASPYHPEFESIVTVVDFYENEHIAILITSELSQSLDLAVLKITKTVELQVLEFSSEDIIFDTTVYSASYPSGIYQFTIGSLIGTSTLSTYPEVLIQHTAFTNSGSSGGALLDSNSKLLGIHVSALSSNGQFVAGYAIPVERINLFLESVVN